MLSVVGPMVKNIRGLCPSCAADTAGGIAQAPFFIQGVYMSLLRDSLNRCTYRSKCPVAAMILEENERIDTAKRVAFQKEEEASASVEKMEIYKERYNRILKILIDNRRKYTFVAVYAVGLSVFVIIQLVFLK
jgi:hypothetical protein